MHGAQLSHGFGLMLWPTSSASQGALCTLLRLAVALGTLTPALRPQPASGSAADSRWAARPGQELGLA